MSKKVYIIDFDLICNWKGQLINVFEKEVGEFGNYDISNVHISNLWKHFYFPKFVEIKNDRSISGEEYEGFQEVAIIQDMEAESEPRKDYFTKFVSDNVLEIFGHARETSQSVIHSINQLLLKGHQVIIYSEYKTMIIPAMYFFLSKFAYKGTALFGYDVGDLVGDKDVEEIYDIENIKELLN